jgi:putative Mg2+ transporter-C (MgtC) family protein
MELREVTYLAVALRIVVAMIVGGLIGLERGIKNRAAGLRTHMLVCVGACLIMLTNQYIFQVYGTGDPVRMGAQVVSGIGFLGAGTIVVTRKSQIKGLTTAAGLWAAAGVGLAIGIGFYEAGILGGATIFTVITLMHRMDNKVHSKGKSTEIYFELDKTCTLGDFIRCARALDINVDDVQLEAGFDRDQETRAYIATLKTEKRRLHAEVLADIEQIPGVVFLEGL